MPHDVKSRLEKDLEIEIEFIFNQLLEKRSQQDNFYHHEDDVKSQIKKILLLIRSEKH